MALFFVALLTLFMPVTTVFAQQDVPRPTSVNKQNNKQDLQNQLDIIEGQIASQQKVLDQTKNQRKTLQSQVATFNAEIKKTQLQIQAINLTISKLNGDIGARNKTLTKLSDKLADEKESLAHILRQTQMLDDYSIVDVAISSKSISDFFTDLDSFASINKLLIESFERINDLSAKTEDEKEELNVRLTEQEQLRGLAQLAKQEVQLQEKEKQLLLTKTKGVESNYQKLIAANQRTAAQIRAELFDFRDSAAIPFGTALLYAQMAEKATGTRAALTLGILKQETNLGKNLGSGSWQIDMHPTRDRPVFVYLTQILGLDPNKMLVSKRPSYGWGGAMGPGQFIPSTWVCYGGLVNSNTNGCSPSGAAGSFWNGPWRYEESKDRVRKLLGTSSPSNPWNAKIAIMATAMLMADNGASTQLYADERTAALRYFAGWVGARNRAYAFYGDGVMGFATKFQKDINLLQ